VVGAVGDVEVAGAVGGDAASDVVHGELRARRRVALAGLADLRATDVEPAHAIERHLLLEREPYHRRHLGGRERDAPQPVVDVGDVEMAGAVEHQAVGLGEARVGGDAVTRAVLQPRSGERGDSAARQRDPPDGVVQVVAHVHVGAVAG